MIGKLLKKAPAPDRGITAHLPQHEASSRGNSHHAVAPGDRPMGGLRLPSATADTALVVPHRPRRPGRRHRRAPQHRHRRPGHPGDPTPSPRRCSSRHRYSQDDWPQHSTNAARTSRDWPGRRRTRRRRPPGGPTERSNADDARRAQPESWHHRTRRTTLTIRRVVQVVSTVPDRSGRLDGMSDVEGETEKILAGPSLRALLDLWEKATGRDTWRSIQRRALEQEC